MDPMRRPAEDTDDDEEDDIHTINSTSFLSHHDRPSVSSGSGLMQISPQTVVPFAYSGSGSGNSRVVHRGIPLAVEPQPPTLPLFHSTSNTGGIPHPTLTQTSSSAVDYGNTEFGRHHVVNDDESDDQTTTTMDYPQSMNSFYSHRDALSANGSYGADMSFVTTQTSYASPAPPPPQQEQQPYPRLHLDQVSDDVFLASSGIDSHRTSISQIPTATTINPSSYRNHVEATHSAIKAAMERGTNMAYDESSSVIGHSTGAHTIASSSNMTKENNDYYHSTFLRNHNYRYNETNSAAVNNKDDMPTAIPLSPSLPFKGTDLTADSMFLGMDYDDDYIKTKLKAADSKTTERPLPASLSVMETEEAIHRMHRKRILCCVFTLIALIVVVGVGGMMCSFGMTCPGIEKLASRSSNGSSATANNNEVTFQPTPSPVVIRNNEVSIPTANVDVVSTTTVPPTRSPVVTTQSPTKRPVTIVIPPTQSPVVIVEDTEPPTTSPVDEEPSPTNESNDNNNSDNENDPTNESNNGGDTGGSPNNSDNEPDKEPTTAPARPPNNVVEEVPTTTPTPTIKPTLLNIDRPTNNIDDDRNQNATEGDDEIPTESPTSMMMTDDTDTRNNDTDDRHHNSNGNTEDDDTANNNNNNNNNDDRMQQP